MPNDYEAESAALDARILSAIAAWHERGIGLDDDAFNILALDLFAYQLRWNAPYARYCALLGVTPQRMPLHWEAIPPVPAAAFKEAALTTGDPVRAALTFETSGTTRGKPGRHYLETRDLYDAALLAGFDRFLLPDGARLRYLHLVPDVSERPASSLGYMMARVSAMRGDGRAGWYLHGDRLDDGAFVRDASAAIAEARPVCVAATAFALAFLLERLAERGIALALPPGSRVMETGGFKGRTRAVERDVLYARASERLGVPARAIVAEYGMTELTSQYYDDALLAGDGPRRKSSPPWLRARVVGPDGTTLPAGSVGALVHVDLANRSSCVAIRTEDLGARFDDARGGFALIGRDAAAPLRGCSLDAETLLPR
jgi:hypothetical protein